MIFSESLSLIPGNSYLRVKEIMKIQSRRVIRTANRIASICKNDLGGDQAKAEINTDTTRD